MTELNKLKTHFSMLVELQAKYPECFPPEPRPLKIRIHVDLIEAGYSKADLRRFLSWYVRRPSYARTLVAGAARVDLGGNPAGTVTNDQSSWAEQHKPKPKQSPKPATKAPEKKPKKPVVSDVSSYGRDIWAVAKAAQQPKIGSTRFGGTLKLRSASATGEPK